MRASSILAVAGASMLMLAACGVSSMSGTGSTAPRPGATASSGLSGSQWVMRGFSAAGGPVHDYVLAPTGPPQLGFGEAGKLSGTTGCNSFGGTYEETADSLTIAVGAVTTAACGSPATALQEKEVLAALPLVAAYTSTGPRLKLLDREGRTLLSYVAVVASLPGTSWRATGINNGKGAVVTVTGTRDVTATFDPDRRMTGDAGCNTYGGPYVIEGENSLVLGPLSVTSMACEEPAMTTESDYLAALDRVATYEITGSTLTLRDLSGAAQVTYQRKAAP